jgi:hypothetical protein
VGIPLYYDTEKRNNLLSGEEQVFQLVSNITLTAAGPFAAEVCPAHTEDSDHQNVTVSLTLSDVIICILLFRAKTRI